MNSVETKTGGSISRILGTMVLGACVLTMTACGGGDDGGSATAPGGGGGGGGGTTAGQFAYVINAGDSNIESHRLDNDGNLSPVVNQLATGTLPHHVDVDPRGRFVYVSNHESAFLSGYRINSADGSLSAINPAPGSPVTGLTADPTENQSHSSVMDRDGQHLYVVAGPEVGASSTLRAYTIDNSPANLGALTPIPAQSFPVGIHAHNITISPNDQFVYVASEGSGEVYAFFRNADGTLQPRGRMTGLPDATAVRVDPQNRFLYATFTNAVEVFQIAADGSLTRIAPTSTFPTNQSGPHSFAMHPNGQFLYVANINSNTITVFRVDSTTGVLTEIQTPQPATGIDPNYVAVHPNGRFLYTADTVSDRLSRFAINADGTLVTPSVTIPAGNGANGIGTTRF